MVVLLRKKRSEGTVLSMDLTNKVNKSYLWPSIPAGKWCVEPLRGR